MVVYYHDQHSRIHSGAVMSTCGNLHVPSLYLWSLWLSVEASRGQRNVVFVAKSSMVFVLDEAQFVPEQGVVISRSTCDNTLRVVEPVQILVTRERLQGQNLAIKWPRCDNSLDSV